MAVAGTGKGRVQFELSAVDKTKAAFDSVDRSIGKLTGSFNTFKGLASGALVVGAVTGFDRLARSAVATTDRIAKLSAAVGISTSSLQEYRFAAGLAGVEQDALDEGLKKFSRNLSDARGGTGTLTEFLKDYDQALLKSVTSAGNVDEALRRLFAGMDRVGDASDKGALAVAAFGRAGFEMTNLVKDGAAGLAKMREEAQRVGVVIDESLIRRSEELSDRLDVAGKIIDANLNTVLAEMAPLAVAASEAVAKLGQSLAFTIDALGGTAGRTSAFIRHELTGVLDLIAELEGKLAASPNGLLSGTRRTMLADAKSRAFEPRGELESRMPLISGERAGTGAPSTSRRTPPAGKSALPSGLSFGPGSGSFRAAQDEGMAVADQAAAQWETYRLAAERAAKADADAATEAERHSRAVADLVSNLEFEAEGYGKTAMQREVDNNLRAAGVSLYDEEGRRIAEVTERVFMLKEAQQQATDATKAGQEAARDLGLTFSSAFEDAIVNGNNLRGVMAGLMQDIARIAIRKSVTEPLTGLLTKGIGSILGGFLGGPAGFAAGALSFLADGGPAAAGRPYIVGEEGPELFVPSRSGTVIPNGAAVGGGVNVTMHLDLRNSDRDAALMLRAERQTIVNAAVAAVGASIRQGGGLAKLTGARA